MPANAAPPAVRKARREHLAERRLFPKSPLSHSIRCLFETDRFRVVMACSYRPRLILPHPAPIISDQVVAPRLV
jgi:hypothetical protein